MERLACYKEYNSGAVFWSPQKIKDARACKRAKQQEEDQKKLQKANNKDLKEANKLYKKKIAEERRLAREKAKEEKERVRVEKDAKYKRKQEAQNTQKAVQQPQLGKRNASQSSQPKGKRVQRSGVDGEGGRWNVAPSAAPSCTTNCERSAKPQRIFE
ncbi:hypothetical protein EJ02DRAFT_495383 [Clathrospora elynae]|uniref:Uncharacterized protein n=1 Tax=Clathrospora elynae TaxID=706981 RepID=A0A6A5T4A3_9PLEO|nr:hypothetical protein EJ02DRAFT_495383 [Clathrospora elynae]